jgi:hypothetical protein
MEFFISVRNHGGHWDIQNNQAEEDEMGGEWSTNGEDERV